MYRLYSVNYRRTGLGKAAQESPASYIRKQLRLQKQYVAPKQTKQQN